MNPLSPEQQAPPISENKPVGTNLKQKLIRTTGSVGLALMMAACSPHPNHDATATPHSQNQSVESSQSDLESLDSIKQRLSSGILDGWVNERLTHPLEWNARRSIADKINEDLNPLQEKIVNLKDAQDSIEKASLQMKKTNTNKLTIQTTDSITRETVITEVLRDDDGETWTTQELRPDGSIISKAVVDAKTGKTNLTLDFKGKRYKDANPHLVNDPRFPKATIKTFGLSTGAVLSQSGKN